MKVFYVDGYWKYDHAEIAEEIICEHAYDELNEIIPDENVFFYGMTEDEIIDAMSEDSEYEFVITDYSVVTI